MNSKHKQLKEHCQALLVTAKQGDPWVFLCAAAYIEFLAKMTIDGKDQYTNFVSKYLSRINPLYANFEYRNGKKDLPQQMWSVLRNGLVHSFTLQPNKLNEGRINSILLSHDAPHLTAPITTDSCILNAYSFINDLVSVTDLIYEDSQIDPVFEKRVNNFCTANPPLGVVF